MSQTFAALADAGSVLILLLKLRGGSLGISRLIVLEKVSYV